MRCQGHFSFFIHCRNHGTTWTFGPVQRSISLSHWYAFGSRTTEESNHLRNPVLIFASWKSTMRANVSYPTFIFDLLRPQYCSKRVAEEVKKTSQIEVGYTQETLARIAYCTAFGRNFRLQRCVSTACKFCHSLVRFFFYSVTWHL